MQPFSEPDCEDNIGEVSDCLTECSLCFEVMADLRRYLYRNAACEARKLSDIARQCVHDPGPYGPWCSGDHGGICLQRIPAEVMG